MTTATATQNKTPNTKNQGFSLVLTVVSLLGLSLLVLAWAGEQIMVQFKHLQLQQQRAGFSQELEQQFEQLADSVLAVRTLAGPLVNRAPAKGASVNGKWFSQINAVACSHPKPTSSTCWSVRVEHLGSGAVRERVLHVPAETCAAPYWLAPAALMQLVEESIK